MLVEVGTTYLEVFDTFNGSTVISKNGAHSIALRHLTFSLPAATDANQAKWSSLVKASIPRRPITPSTALVGGGS